MKVSIWIVTPERDEYAGVFRDIADTLRWGFEDEGHEAEIVTAALSPEDCDRVVILGGNRLIQVEPIDLDPEKTVIYNLEQAFNGSPWFSDYYIEALRKYKAVDYSRQNIKALKSFGVEAEYAPVCHHRGLERIPKREKEFDVFFYGSLNERRKDLLDSLKRRGLTVEARFNLFGGERDELIARARCVINTHYYESNVLETVRISYLLGNAIPVVSEVGSDEEDCWFYRDGIVFGGYENLPSLVSALLSVDAAREAVGHNGQRIMRGRPISDYINVFLGGEAEEVTDGEETIKYDQV